MKITKDRCGISLILLVVTIVVMTIVATVFVITLQDADIVQNTEEVAFKTDFKKIIDSFSEVKSSDVRKQSEYTASSKDEIKSIIPYISKVENKKIGGKNYYDLIQILDNTIYQKPGINDEKIEKWLADVGILAMPLNEASEDTIYTTTYTATNTNKIMGLKPSAYVETPYARELLNGQTTLVIPDMIDGVPVTSIAGYDETTDGFRSICTTKHDTYHTP